MKLIGLTGKARSGKDTVADRMVWQCGDELMTYAFADPIKDMLFTLLGPAYAEAAEHKELATNWTGKSLRELCQTLGTEWGRNLIDQNIWLKRAGREYQKNKDLGYQAMVITDVRTANEAQWIRDRGGILIQLNRESREQVRPHESENGICKSLVNHQINNNGALEELYQQVDEILRGEGLL